MSVVLKWEKCLETSGIAEHPELFLGDRFLDVGCNKGWFSLRSARSFQRVLGIDPDPRFIELCQSVAPWNCEFRVDSFGTLETDQTFDSVFMGNGPHYPFVEAGGWGFVEKLARLSSSLVVTEGPLGMDCKDMEMCIPEHLKPQFNPDAFRAAMGKHFELVRFAMSPAYTPNRHILAWKRMDDLINCSMERYADYLRIVYREMAQWIEPTDEVVEVCVRHDRGVISRDVIPCAQLDGLDLDPSRCPMGGYKANAITDTLPQADVYISTAILHHTYRKDIPELLRNIRKSAKRAIFTGPSASVMRVLIGDHRWHIDHADLADMAARAGWRVVALDGIGLNPPYCELMVVMDKV